MPVFAGRILLADDVVEGWIQVDGGRIVAAGRDGDDGLPAPPTARGWIVPSLVNAHTHAADTFLRDAPGKPATVRELVGPGGWKHRQLGLAAPERLQEGFRQLAQETAATGALTFVDFREGGPAGAKLLRDVSSDLAAEPIVMGRPAQTGGAGVPSRRGQGTAGAFDEGEAAQLLEHAQGVGLSGLRDMPAVAIDAWADLCRARRRLFAFHASEDARDDAGRIVALRPSFVVHMNQGRPADFDELAQAGTPVAVCPRSNRFFGYRTPVPAMLEAGLSVAVGTDNGMLQDGDVLQELALLRAWWPDVGVADLLRTASFGGRRILGRPAPRFPRPGDEANWVVLPRDPIPPAPGTKPSISPALHTDRQA